MNEQAIADMAPKLKALANEGRLMVVALLLKHGELSVSELNESIPLSQSALSQHLAVLRREEMVTTRRASQTIHYRNTKNTEVLYRAVMATHDPA